MVVILHLTPTHYLALHTSPIETAWTSLEPAAPSPVGVPYSHGTLIAQGTWTEVNAAIHYWAKQHRQLVSFGAWQRAQNARDSAL